MLLIENNLRELWSSGPRVMTIHASLIPIVELPMIRCCGWSEPACRQSGDTTMPGIDFSAHHQRIFILWSHKMCKNHL